MELRFPTVSQIENELKREIYKEKFRRVLANNISILINVAAISVLVATLWLPVLQIYGTSMAPILMDGEYVVSIKSSDYERGDIIAFYYNNKILVKRVIAVSGDYINIDDDGNVYVNGLYLEEDYVLEKALGDSNIKYPYQVPESRVFVMGDHRATSIDSRNTSVGCVGEEQVVGRIVLRLWPITQIGTIE